MPAAAIVAALLLPLVSSYTCDLSSVAVPALSAQSWQKFPCTASDVASQVYSYTVSAAQGASDLLTVYATDGVDCSATSYSPGLTFYPEGSAGTSGGTLAPVSRSSVPCERGPPCCLFVLCDNTPGFSCAPKVLTVQFSAAPTPSPSTLPTPSPTPNANPQAVCNQAGTAVPVLERGVGYQAYSCNSPLVTGYQYSMSIANPNAYYIAAYATMGKFCTMDPTSAGFKYMTQYSPGYATATSANPIQASGIPCTGTVTDYLGLYPEGVYSSPCCTVILCSELDLTNCNGLAITQTFVLASRTPTPSSTPAPGSSAAPSPAAGPTSQPQNTCGAVTGVAMPLQEILSYFTWSCSDKLITGGTVDVTVRNPKGDRLSIYVTSGTNCARSPNSFDFRASASVLDVVTPTISLQGKECGDSPCCAVVVCVNTFGSCCA